VKSHSAESCSCRLLSGSQNKFPKTNKSLKTNPENQLFGKPQLNPQFFLIHSHGVRIELVVETNEISFSQIRNNSSIKQGGRIEGSRKGVEGSRIRQKVGIELDLSAPT
jgi:hypothetical protein